MAKTYDLIVIGTGTAAQVAATRCRSAGWQVAVVDHLPFGGTCALRGCDPKKVLVGAAEAIDHARRMRGKGIAGGEPAIAWSELIKFKRGFTGPVPPMMEKSFAKSGIDAYHGRARFRDRRSVEVGGEALEGRFVLIAAGAVPMRLGIPGEEHLATSTDFLELDALPKRIALVGGNGDNGGIRLTDSLKSTSTREVYAAGDVAAGGRRLTRVAGHDGRVAAANMLNGNREKPNYLGVPSVAFSIPPIARVGLLEAEARQQQLRVRVTHEKTAGWYTARRVAESASGFKIIVEEGSNRILGAHLIGPNADEVINIFGVAIRHGLTTDNLKSTIFGYPTAASDIGYML